MPLSISASLRAASRSRLRFLFVERHAAARSSLSAPRITILSASSGTVRCNTFISWGELRNVSARDAADVTDREAATYWGGAA